MPISGGPSARTGAPTEPDGPARTAPVVHSSMRSANLGLLLRHLRRHGGRSRATLAQETGLSKAAVTTLVHDLAGRGLVRTGPTERHGGVGRPGTEVRIDPDRVAGLGVEITAEYVSVNVVDLGGTTRLHDSRATPGAPAAPVQGTARDLRTVDPHLLDVVAEAATGALAWCADRGLRVAGLGVAAPGAIDYARGRVRIAPALGWQDLPLAEELVARLGPAAPPISLENDAKLSALAEAPVLAADGIEDMVFLTGGTGVGAGIIAGGRLVRGWSGFSGEVGHMGVEPSGPLCHCGRRGCWEALVGFGAVLGAVDPADAVRREAMPVLERFARIRSLLDAGDPRLTERFACISEDLSRGAGIVVDLLNPRRLVLGGYFDAFADLLLEPLQTSLSARRLVAEGAVEVRRATYGLDSAARGAADLALEAVLEDPALVPSLPR